MALAHILDATLATSSLALGHIPDATLPTSSRALAHIPDATLPTSSLALAHIPDATLQMGLCGVGWGGLRTFNGTSTHTWCYATGLFSCTCTHTGCYATASSRALAHIPMAMALGKQCLCQSEPFDSRDSSSEHAVKVLRQKKPKSPIFLFSPCGETQIHQKTRHPETASFYSWRSQKRVNTTEKWWKNKTQWN